MTSWAEFYKEELTMAELFSRLAPSDVAMLTGITIVLVAALIGCGLAMWFRHAKTQLTIQLKQQMLERGMSAEEIEAVLKAGARQ